MPNIYFKNLGCPKNEVDGNILANMLKANQATLVDDPEKADIIIVNTCGFIDSAKEESIDTVLELSLLKEKRNIKLVLAGCLAQRYKRELIKQMPEIDLVVGIGNLLSARDQIMELSTKRPSDNRLTERYREYDIAPLAGAMPYGYLKISDGCDNFCTYCAIPHIRGRHRSRKFKFILDEARAMAQNGTRELIIVAQDTTQYGIDLYGQRRLPDLLKALENIPDIGWIRLLYTHPAHYTDNLIDFLSISKKVVPYLDLPLQHISDPILKRMNRKVSADDVRRLIDRLRRKIDNLVLRTTFILGFPGETEKDFKRLWRFQNDYALERVGVFPYSREEDTGAYDFKPEVPGDVAAERIDRLMTLVMDQSYERNQKMIGRKLEVLIDEKVEDDYYIGRAFDQAPEIDGYIRAHGRFDPGRFVELQIRSAEAYDLDGVAMKEG